MRIANVAITERTLPVRGLSTSYGDTTPERSYVFVRITTDTGLTGYGEAACLTRFTGETPASVAAVIEEAFPLVLLEQDPFAIEVLYRELTTRYPHNTTAVAAIDIAVHDLMGKAVRRPVSDLLGGTIHDKLDVAGACGIDDAIRTAELALAQVEAGAKVIKLKVGRDLQRDEAAVAAVRDAVGPDIGLRVDANQGLTVREAQRLMRAIRGYDIQYVEQPVAHWDIAGLAELRRTGGIPVAADEANLGPREALTLLQARAVDYLVVKLIKCGGLFAAKQILRLADLYGVPCTITSPYETGIGAAANIQLAATHPRLSGPIEVLNPSGIEGNPGDGLEFDKGQVLVPAKPGIGVSVTEDLFK